MSKLRLGVIGSGGVLENAHLPAWRLSDEVEIAAFCDVSRERAQTLADKHGVRRVFTDYRDLLAEADIDIVDICTPSVYHAEMAIAAMQAGKHVFVEKPDAIHPAEAEQMARVAASEGKVLMSMRNNRFRAETAFLKRYIAAGQMGEIYTGRCGWLRRRGLPGGWRVQKALSGGGPVMDFGIHYLDLAVWLMGNPQPVAVSGAAYTKFGDPKTMDVEDLATGLIRFNNGATLQLEFSFAANIEEEDVRFVELRGTRAGCALRNNDLTLFTEIEGTMCDIQPKCKQAQGGHIINIRHFVAAVRGRETPAYGPEEGLTMIRILAALYESAETGREVRLDV